ncbi:MAG TPA: 50S ribosomal protein L3 N(5)-glutamine methyltransferase, partial [Porticoccaceae bacterium]|nr:50S ribosomal protein L3 N(5)-glutamine methyltransferase [Porticoccaceae bacterium]
MRDPVDTNDLKTVGDYLRFGEQAFIQAGLYFGHGTDNAWDEAVVLLLHTLKMPPDSPASLLDQPLSRAQADQTLELFSRRIRERVPAPYLTGETWFAGLPFHVNTDVLIPRSPIAELIEQAFQPWLQQSPASVLDLCTGSGCIGIACAHAFPEAQVELLDLSFDALAVAEENIEQHEVGDRVIALQSDLYAAASGKYDLIVTNPPYVDADDMACLPEEYHHEPEIALAAGNDGLDLVHTILSEAKEYLTDDGLLVLEVGNS